MTNIKNISSVYFAGIGGIGMSAIARYFKTQGARVSGYDKTATPLTKKMQEEGIEIHFEDDAALLDKFAELVVYTPALPVTHRELQYYRDNNYLMLKRSEVLGLLTADGFNICVAGTHGKTTTCAMIAHILRDSGYGCNAFLGGIAANYDTNFWHSENKVSVAEADEYDRSFLKLSPDIAVITAMDPDHLEIYGTEKNMQDAFLEFAQRVRPGGMLFVKDNIPRIAEFRGGGVRTYSATNEHADVHAENVIIENGGFRFDVCMGGQNLKGLSLNMGGLHNVENATAAVAVATQLKIDGEKIRKGLASFAGVKRRFEYIWKGDGVVMIDDYAHHPEELRALINGAKNLFPEKKCTVIFQPHLFSRTKDLAAGFAEALSLADSTVLLPIYPAREQAMPGVASELILEKMTNEKRIVLEKEQLAAWLKKNQPELLITAGAGDIDAMVQQIKQIIIEQK